ncbi:MAG: DUF485 domain-containing protein [Thermanaeromonas sp.]|uniref:DUF485 domain-containing protein n=1 Tax=Thermanaeromonas sp. TaxID=2003697 RepID=UPI00243CEB7E|nr:DUF485 domain-containing protein [Thermanaeromonas sp.]MCG0277644.1 DUF485 domain-containing protein [Thermanaeromonas sp.]
MISTETKIVKTTEFKALVSSRWLIAAILSSLVSLTYYGFILMIGLSKTTVARKIGEATTLGIPLALLVIVVCFFLTIVYVLWSNVKYDNLVTSLRNKLSQP